MLVSANIFQPLIDVFESVLKFFHDSAGVSWGWSIILLTVCVRAILIPLTVKQFGSMQRMQQIQPELKALQAKYKDDKERQQQEVMRFYRENKVNPLGSCLPMVLQIPVFISLFYMLRQSLRVDICPAHQPHLASGAINIAHLRPCGVGHGAGFLFVGDLTNKGTGITLIVLIVLYVGTQLASSMMMSSATMDKTQRQIMMFMPLVFVIFVINFPAGLMVYWITTNTWTMAQQYIIRRRIGPVRAAPAAVTAGATSVVASGKSGSGGEDANGSNGAGEGGGLAGGLGAWILARANPQRQGKPAAEAKVTTPPSKPARPPQSPRKKKKRSGRRR
jgi:YidC/Oxa1 family membrane protein insertase